MRRYLFLPLAAVLLAGCFADPSKHVNMGPPQVVMTAYGLAIKGDLPATEKYFSAAVKSALKTPDMSLAKVWEGRTLLGHVKGINVSNQKDAGNPNSKIIEGHVVLDTGQLQEIEELVIKEGDVWVIDGVRPRYSPGMPESLMGTR
jgi:hypothetical protein